MRSGNIFLRERLCYMNMIFFRFWDIRTFKRVLLKLRLPETYPKPSRHENRKNQKILLKITTMVGFSLCKKDYEHWKLKDSCSSPAAKN